MSVNFSIILTDLSNDIYITHISSLLTTQNFNSTYSSNPSRKINHQTNTIALEMNILVFATLLPLVLVSAVPTKDPYPAPCGRSDPSGICTTKDTCYKKGGFYVQRDCTFYNVLDIGCCYNVPDEK